MNHLHGSIRRTMMGAVLVGMFAAPTAEATPVLFQFGTQVASAPGSPVNGMLLFGSFEGAPIIRAEIWRALGELKAEGLSMIVIDKNLGPLLTLADRHFVMEKGRVVWSGDSDALRDDPRIVHEYLGV